MSTNPLLEISFTYPYDPSYFETLRNEPIPIQPVKMLKSMRISKEFSKQFT